MITSAKCNCCIHEAVCVYKYEYANACDAINALVYSTPSSAVVLLRDAEINVHIRCAHMYVEGRDDDATTDRA